MATTARDIMTQSVISVSPDSSVADVMEIITENRITGLPVVDEDGDLVGIISEADLLNFDDPTHFTAVPVSDYMTETVITVEETTTLEDVSDLLMSAVIRRVPVTREGRMVGIISRRDLVRAMSEMGQE